MYYKPDWEEAKKRIEAFWQNEVIDRCCIAVLAPREHAAVPLYVEQQYGPLLYGLDSIADDDQEGIKRWWTDPEEHYKRYILWFENTYFGGEAIPAVDINWGAMAMAGFYGSSPVFAKKTVWYPPVIEDWGTWEWKFDRSSNELWNQTLAVTRYLVERSEGRYFVGYPEIGSAGDLLALMRGTDKLCTDLLDHPDEVKRGIQVLTDAWIELHEQFFQMTRPANHGGAVLAWMMLWAPGRIAQVACDFSGIISRKMFREFFRTEIERESGWNEFGTYHLDGPQALRAHLPTLLEIPAICNIEWTPGVGSPPTYSPQYIPVYKQIQQAGKRLYLLAHPNEVEPLLAELSPKGLYICTYTESIQDAERLLKHVAKWSASRSIGAGM
jgi:hypothetical protein